MSVFTPSRPLTLGVELELQLVNPDSCDLLPCAPALLDRLADSANAEQFKPEITQSMLEINSSVHSSVTSLHAELRALRDQLVAAADSFGALISGGGTHPFQHWADRNIYPSERFEYLAETYGYLARRFTVFGQHIHVGVPDGDRAIELSQRLLPYMPHFVALSASSPFHLGVDTGLDCARLAAIWTFPLAGHMPPLRDWAAFDSYLDDLMRLGVASGIKDLYWDVRPKPEFGTVEIRIADSPLQVARAAQLAAYAQALVAAMLDTPMTANPDSIQRVHRHNLFQACRYGYAGTLVNPETGQRRSVGEDIIASIQRLAPQAARLGISSELASLAAEASGGLTDAARTRARLAQGADLKQLVREHCQRWRQ